MKNLYATHSFLLLILLLLTSPSMYAQGYSWEPLGGPYGAPTDAIVRTARGTLLAATYNGLFRSDNEGESWTRSGTGLSNEIRNLAVHPDGNVIALGSYARPLLSTDDGYTWLPMPTDPPGAYFLSLAAGPEGRVYAGGMSGFAGYPSGVFASTNHGATWEHRGLKDANVSAILADTGGIIIAGVNGYTDVGGAELQRSTDWGATWSKVTTRIQLYYGRGIVALSLDSTGTYWLAQSQALHRSTDRGATWDSVASPFRYPESGIRAFTIMPDGSLLVGTSSGPYRSSDKGATWMTVGTWPDSADVLAFAFIGTTIIVGTDIGILLSTDNGMTWEERNGAIPSSASTLAAGSGRRLIAKTSVGVQTTVDGGNSWRRKALNVDYANSVTVGPDGDFFIGTNSGNLYRSTDDGMTWTTTRPSTHIYTLATNSQGYLFAAMRYRAIDRSTDNGVTWDSTMIHISESGIRAIVFDSTIGFAATYDGLFFTTDNGDTWLPTIITEPVVAFAIGMQGNIYAVGTQMLYHSTDKGATWNSFTPSLPLTSLAVTDAGVLLGVSADRRNDSKRYVFQSNDDGRTWSVAQQKLPPDSVATELAASPDGSIFLGTRGYGIYRLSEQALSMQDVRSDYSAVDVRTMDQGAAIALTSTAPAHTSITIHNSIGQRVAVMVSEVLEAGRHTYMWNAERMASGAYVVHICRDGDCATRMVMIAR